MYALVTVRYLKPLDQVQKLTDAHRAWLATWRERGVLLAAGPFVPRTGGAILLRVPDEQTIAEIRDGDPFVTSGAATYEINVWSPTIGADTLAKL
jgi:uncharacterized protein YciI